MEFRNAAGEVQFVMPVPNITDSAAPEGAYTNAVAYQLSQQGSGWSLTVTPDYSWLTDPARVFPVTIDPSVDKADQKDCWIQQDMPNANRCQNDYVYAGKGGGSTRRGLLDFSMNGQPAGITVNSATLYLFLDSNMNVGNGGTGTFSVYQPSQQWAQAATWNTSGITAWNGGGSGNLLSSNSVPLSGSTASNWVGWDVTNAVAGWVNGNIENRGFLVREDNEGTSRQAGFLSGTNQLTQWRPILRLDYTPPPTQYFYEAAIGFPDGSEVSFDANSGAPSVTNTDNEQPGLAGRFADAMRHNETDDTVNTSGASVAAPSVQGDPANTTTPARGSGDPGVDFYNYPAFSYSSNPNATVPEKFYLQGTSVLSDYIYKSNPLVAKLRQCYTNALGAKICGTIGRVNVSFREQLNGGSSHRWSIPLTSTYVDGPSYNAYGKYWCGINLKGTDDLTCASSDPTADASNVGQSLNNPPQGTGSTTFNESFGDSWIRHAKYPLVQFGIGWPAYGVVVYVPFRGWDIRLTGSVWKMSPVSGTGY